MSSIFTQYNNPFESENVPAPEFETIDPIAETQQKASASKAYWETRYNVDGLLKQIKIGLKAFDASQQRSPKDWSYAGSIADTLQHLMAAAHSIGAIDDDEYEAFVR